MGRLPQLLEDAVGFGRAERVFADTAMPFSPIEHPDAPMPITTMVDLFESSGSAVGDRCFGLRVGLDMGHLGFGKIAAFAAQAPTLYHALQRARIGLAMHQPGGRFLLGETRAGWLWSYVAPPSGRAENRHHCDHVLPGLISLCREFLGDDWSPRRVSVPYADDGARRELQDILACDWFFSRKGVSVELRESELRARRIRTLGASRQQPIITSCEILASAIQSECGDAVDTIEALIQLRLLDGNVDIEILARLAGASTRSLQRQLHLSGTTYREIVQRAKMRRAAALISESCLTLTDIGLSLGYSDTGNFSRAFRKHFGRSPSSLRRCG
jgi:AraC-like DNA-binding protein